VESFIILAVAAGLSAAVVWWGMNQPGGRPKPKKPRKVPVPVPAPAPQPAAALGDELAEDDFVVHPTTQAEPPLEDRPSPALSIVRLALTITFFAALAVGVLTVLGILVSNQIAEFFTGL
jgi:hypothetical protein